MPIYNDGMEPIWTLDEPNWDVPAPPTRRWLRAILWACVALGCTLAVLFVLVHLVPTVGAAGGCGGG